MARRALLLGTAVAGVALALIAARDALAKYEEPIYTVAAKADNIEIREYPSVLAAQVSIERAGSGSDYRAFEILAGYIFGKNSSSRKIAMTVPVTEQVPSEKIAMTVPVTTQIEKDTMQMRFFMPAQYSLNTLPRPLDERIEFKQLPPARYAVIRFSGIAHEKAIEEKTSQLMDYLREQHEQPSGSPLRAFYNPPWTLPFLRRNELWIPLQS